MQTPCLFQSLSQSSLNSYTVFENFEHAKSKEKNLTPRFIYFNYFLSIQVEARIMLRLKLGEMRIEFSKSKIRKDSLITLCNKLTKSNLQKRFKSEAFNDRSTTILLHIIVFLNSHSSH